MMPRNIKNQKNIYKNKRLNILKLNLNNPILEEHTDCKEEK